MFDDGYIVLQNYLFSTMALLLSGFLSFTKYRFGFHLWVHEAVIGTCEQSLREIKFALILNLYLWRLQLFIHLIGDSILWFTAVELIRLPIGVLSFPAFLGFRVRVDHSVAASFLEPQALLFTQKRAQCGFKVSIWLDKIYDISFACQALSSELKPFLVSICLATLAETKPAWKEVS